MAVAIELTLYPLADFLQGIFDLALPAIGCAMGGSIAFLCVRASLKWMKRI
jgi:hypothetical protein